MLRWLTAGESHGRALVAICEGMPAGVRIATPDIAAALARRRAGYGRGARMKFEQDEAEITGGVRHGRTLGGPVAIRVANTEWPKWDVVMSPDPVAAAELAELARAAPLTRPRPGHADLAGMQKYGHADARPVLERASARETAARVALGELARRFLQQVLGAQVLSHVVAIGTVTAPDGMPGPQDADRVDADPVRCLDPAASEAMRAEIDTARRRGSVAHDEIGRDQDGVRRRTNRAGGIEGGMSTGELIRLRAAMKPISTVPRALATVDVRTGEPARAINQRSDVTAVPAAGVVAEAMAALVLADATLEKFGGDSVTETARNLRGYLEALVIS